MEHSVRSSLATLLFVLATSPILHSQERSTPFAVEQGVVQMRLVMGSVVLKMTLHFDRYGERQLVSMTGDAIGRTVDMMNLDQDGTRTMWDNTTRHGVRLRLTVPPLGPLEMLSGITLGDDPSNKKRAIDSATILDRSCQGTEVIANGVVLRLWRWRGIPLRVRLKGDNTEVQLDATSIDMSVKVDEKVFSIPPGLKFDDKTGASH